MLTLQKFAERAKSRWLDSSAFLLVEDLGVNITKSQA